MPVSSLTALPARPPTSLRLDSSFRLPRDPLGYHGLPPRQSQVAYQAAPSQGRPVRLVERVMMRASVVPATLRGGTRDEASPFLPRFSHSNTSRMHPAGLQVPFRGSSLAQEPRNHAAPTMPPAMAKGRSSAWPSQYSSTRSDSLRTPSDQLGHASDQSPTTRSNAHRRLSGLRNVYKPEANAPPSDPRLPPRHRQPALVGPSHNTATTSRPWRGSSSSALRGVAAETHAAKASAATNRLPACSLASRLRDEPNRFHSEAIGATASSAMDTRKFVPNPGYTQAQKSAPSAASIPPTSKADATATNTGLLASSNQGRYDGGANRRLVKLPARPRPAARSAPLPLPQIPHAIFATPRYSPLPTRFQSPEDPSPDWLAEALYGPSYQDWQEMRDDVELNERSIRLRTGGDGVNKKKRARVEVEWNFELWEAEVEQRRRTDKRQKRR